MHPSSKGDRRPCQCLLQLESWSEQWLLSFNTEKCKVLKLGEVDNGQYSYMTIINKRSYYVVKTKRILECG